MSYMDDFNARMNASGNTIGESQFNSTANFINSTFANSPFYKVVRVNGQTDLGVRLVDIDSVTRSSSVQLVQYVLKFILLKPNASLTIGDTIKLDDQFWIVTDYRGENTLFPKAKIGLCNSTFTVQSGKTKTVKQVNGVTVRDKDGRPILVETVGTEHDEPCIVSNVSQMSNNNVQLPLPDGRLSIALKYQIADNLSINSEFEMYNNKYSIVDIDYAMVFNGKGIMVIHAQREAEK